MRESELSLSFFFLSSVFGCSLSVSLVFALPLSSPVTFLRLLSLHSHESDASRMREQREHTQIHLSVPVSESSEARCHFGELPPGGGAMAQLGRGTPYVRNGDGERESAPAPAAALKG